MSRKFSLAYLTIPGVSPREQIKIASECGYDFVSLRTIPMHLPGEPLLEMEKNPVLFADTKSALEEYGMKLKDIELARVREDLDVSLYEAAFEKGAELGATDVLSSVWSENPESNLAQFSDICDMAAKYGLIVNLEFVPFAGVRNLKDALALLVRAKKPNARVMVDTLHAHRALVTPEELRAVPRELFGFIHLCDGPGRIPALDDPEMIGVAREGRLYPGDGGVDIAGMLKSMPANVCSIELPNKAETEARGQAGHAGECLARAKAYFAANGID